MPPRSNRRLPKRRGRNEGPDTVGGFVGLIVFVVLSAAATAIWEDATAVVIPAAVIGIATAYWWNRSDTVDWWEYKAQRRAAERRRSEAAARAERERGFAERYERDRPR